jgi:hypothetical protein
VKGEAAALSVRAQRCQSYYFSATPRRLVNGDILKYCLQLYFKAVVGEHTYRKVGNYLPVGQLNVPDDFKYYTYSVP